MSVLVETKNASLDTLSVTIQALHVSGKQMTLAVFRQLPMIESDDGCQLWGIVRYGITGEGSVWLILSRDGRLYRRSLEVNAPSRFEISRYESLGKFSGSQQARARYEDAIAQYDKQNKKFQHDASLEATLPQLFIAV